ncbi:hypothetical protein AcV7_008978 [Taiwanofungus camphoratus]|nr:hypothetical protein AcV7_008978 [Antrodia cinnamomea]
MSGSRDGTFASRKLATLYIFIPKVDEHLEYYCIYAPHLVQLHDVCGARDRIIHFQVVLHFSLSHSRDASRRALLVHIVMVSSNDVQRLFLQAVLSRRALSQKLALKIWEKCIDAVKAANDTLDIPFSNDRNSWDNFISKINDSLNPLNLELAQMHDEFTGKEICVLVNRKGDEIAQLATDYSAVEITYFKAIVEQIMLAPNESYTVSSLAALREVNALKANMTKAQAEVVLNSFVVKGWLVKSKRGRYSLSTRTLIELQPYLRTTYPDQIMECTLCMEVGSSPGRS